MKVSRSLALAFAVVATPAVQAQGRVWVVDDQVEAGVDFREVGAAVKAAADGDLVLVRTGRYSGFRVENKAVSVVAASGASVEIDGRILIDSLTADRDVALRGLRSLEPGRVPLFVSSCDGPVWVEGCEFRGKENEQPWFVEPPAATTLVDAESVVFVRTTIQGGVGEGGGSTTTGTLALRTTSSNVSLFDCELLGGRGGDCDDECGGGAGGGGASVTGDGVLFASGSTVSGGRGGWGGYNFNGLLGTGFCYYGGDGGTGLRLGGLEPSIGYVRGASLSGGAAGPAYAGCWGYDGELGKVSSVTGAASITALAPAARSLSTQSPVPAGQAGRVRFEGEPGDLVMLSISHSFGNAYDPSLAGAVVVGPTVETKVLGVAGPTGVLGDLVTFDAPPPGADFVRYFLQVVVADASGATTVGGASSVVVLAPGVGGSGPAQAPVALSGAPAR